MATHIFDPAAKRRRDAIWGFGILSGFAMALFGMALALGTEPRMEFERTGEHLFRVTGSNRFSGYQFFSRTIEGVGGYRHADGSRNRREDSIRERNLQTRRKRLAFASADGAELSWGRTDDWRVIDDFMRGDASNLSLADPPPLWRAALTWLCLGLGGLILFRAIQCFFPHKQGPTPWS